MIVLRNKNYSDNEPTVRIGHWRNKKKFSELTDKQLRNIARYEEEEHPGYGLLRGYVQPAVGGALTGAIIGAGRGKILKGAGIGALAGTAFGAATCYSGNKLHIKHAKYAKAEIARREKKATKDKKKN